MALPIFIVVIPLVHIKQPSPAKASFNAIPKKAAPFDISLGAVVESYNSTSNVLTAVVVVPLVTLLSLFTNLTARPLVISSLQIHLLI